MEVVEQIGQPVLEVVLEILDRALAVGALLAPVAVGAAQLELPLLFPGLGPGERLNERRLAVGADVKRTGLTAGTVLEAHYLDPPTAR